MTLEPFAPFYREAEWIAKPLLNEQEWPLSVVIAITDTRAKTVSSSAGMSRSAETSAYYPAWVSSTGDDFVEAHTAVENRDFDHLASLAENSCQPGGRFKVARTL